MKRIAWSLTMNEQFKRDGFIHLKQAFNVEQIQELIEATESILHNPIYKKDLLSIDESKYPD